MKKIYTLFLMIISIVACKQDDASIESEVQNELIFGHFYGECIGETCVETFKLTRDALYEDTLDNYSGENYEFVALDKAKFEEVKDLLDYFPAKLLNESEMVFGCPDCGDGGGLLIQIPNNGNKKSWQLDQNKSKVPAYQHQFIDKVNEKIALINR